MQAQHGPEICSGTLDGSACGTYAAGICQGEGCGRPVCSKHGTYMAGRLLCERCTDDARRVREARNAEHARELARLNAEHAAATAKRACDELAAATDPAQILDTLRRYKPLRGATQETSTWRDPAHVEDYMHLVVPAWQRYLAGRQPHHPHEIACLANYQVGRRPDSASRIATRVPCWVSLVGKQQVISHGEKVTVDDAWAFTADTAYHIGNDSGHQRWSRWESGPTLSGDFMVCAGVLPQSFVLRGERHLYHCFAVSDSRPLRGEDVFTLIGLGHQSPVHHDGGNSRTGVQFD